MKEWNNVFWENICRKVMIEVTKQIILVYSTLVRPQWDYCVWFLHHVLKTGCKHCRGNNRKGRFSLYGFTRPHLTLHFCEIIFEDNYLLYVKCTSHIVLLWFPLLWLSEQICPLQQFEMWNPDLTEIFYFIKIMF